jgi:hypothetical protein
MMLVIDLIVLMPLSKIYTGSTNRAGQAAAIFLHTFVYSAFMSGTVWVYISEIFPTKIRAQGAAICTFWGQVMGVILQQVGLQIYNDIGYLFYLVFVICTAVAGVLYFFVLPETKGVTLEDISVFFGDEIVATFEESKMRGDDVLRRVTGGDNEKVLSADRVAKGVAEQVERAGEV